MRLVLIEWVDSFGCSSTWEELSEDYELKPLLCRSVGWLFRDTEDCKVIIPHIADISNDGSQQGCGDMTIPTKSIVSIVDIVDPIERKV